MLPWFSNEHVDEHYDIDKHDIIFGKRASYYVEDILAQGVYGRVACCRQMNTGQRRAVKIVRKDGRFFGVRECETLAKIGKLNPDKNNLIKMLHHFVHNGHVCIVFDIMKENLLEFTVRRKFVPLGMSKVRLIAQQMLVALNAINSIGLVHADLKPDNIMIGDHDSQTIKVKLIDFGLAMKRSELLVGRKIQALAYRAPEVILGLPMDEGVDVWSLGCTLMLLATGSRPHYLVDSEFSVISAAVSLQGLPEDDLLCQGLFTQYFFTPTQTYPKNVWRLNTPKEYTKRTGIKTELPCQRFNKIQTFDDVLKINQSHYGESEKEDAQAFVNLLKRMLAINPGERITPSQALNHPFITMRGVAVDRQDGHASATTKEPPCKKANSKHYAASNEIVSAEGSSNSDQPAFFTRFFNKTAATTSKVPTRCPGSTNKKTKTRHKDPVNPADSSLKSDSGDDVKQKSSRNLFNRIRKFFSGLFRRRGVTN